MSEPLIDGEALELSKWIDRLVVVIVGDVGADLIGPIEPKHPLVPEGYANLSATET